MVFELNSAFGILYPRCYVCLIYSVLHLMLHITHSAV